MIQEEHIGLEQELKLVVQKLNALRPALILKTDESEKFKLEYEIQALESRKTALEKALAEAYQLGTDSGKERLRAVVQTLKISEEMGRLHLVNCNRQEVRDRFEDGFDRRQRTGAANHFYFLSACPTQLPPSLGERMVYELLGDLLDEGPQAVHCRFDPKNHDRVKVEKLPLGYSLEKSQEMFRDFCAKWFGWEDNLAFDAAIAANRLPLARNRYTILPFYLRKKEWKPFFGEYMDWLIAQLAQRPPGGPTLLVFVVLYLDGLHLNTDDSLRGIIGTVDDLCAKHAAAGHFHPLEPVHESDLRDWFTDLGERNNARLQPVFDALEKGLPPEELTQYREGKLLNMDRVELVQEVVFEGYNR